MVSKEVVMTRYSSIHQIFKANKKKVLEMGGNTLASALLFNPCPFMFTAGSCLAPSTSLRCASNRYNMSKLPEGGATQPLRSPLLELWFDGSQLGAFDADLI